MGVAAYCFSELSADEHEGVFLVVALLVEGLSAEVVFGGPEQPFHPFYFHCFVEDVAEDFCMLPIHAEDLGTEEKIVGRSGLRTWSECTEE